MTTSNRPLLARDEMLTWLIYALLALGFVLGISPLLIAAPRLPEFVAVHWSLAGLPDGSMPKRYVLFLPPLLLGPAVVLNWISARASAPSRARLVLPLAMFSAALCGVLGTVLAAANWGRAHWQSAAHLAPSVAVSVVALPLVFALGTLGVAVRRWPASPHSLLPPGPKLPLSGQDRAYWSGSASNRAMLLLLLLGAPVMLLVAEQRDALWALGITHVLCFVLLELLTKIRVTVGEREVRIRYGALGWLSSRLPLDEILEANALELSPLDFGGWGYRWCRGKRTAVVVRAGLALRVALRSGRQWFITVDDAEAAASLINGLIERKRRSG
ncbi:MAG TPA: DUF1648 domain-containing protein [Polyangiaceae bacterium]|nr:DUF1648 domain-containing protein [Polyangiaceae bacterium]